MLGLESLGATGRALSGVGIVLAEAMSLYVTYGAVTTVASEPMERLLQSE